MEVNEAIATLIQLKHCAVRYNVDSRTMILRSPEAVEALEVLLNCDFYDYSEHPIESGVVNWTIDTGRGVEPDSLTDTETSIPWGLHVRVRELRFALFDLKYQLDNRRYIYKIVRDTS